jgi:hypothetical protein
MSGRPRGGAATGIPPAPALLSTETADDGDIPELAQARQLRLGCQVVQSGAAGIVLSVLGILRTP